MSAAPARALLVKYRETGFEEIAPSASFCT